MAEEKAKKAAPPTAPAPAPKKVKITISPEVKGEVSQALLQAVEADALQRGVNKVTVIQLGPSGKAVLVDDGQVPWKVKVE